MTTQHSQPEMTMIANPGLPSILTVHAAYTCRYTGQRVAAGSHYLGAGGHWFGPFADYDAALAAALAQVTP